MKIRFIFLIVLNLHACKREVATRRPTNYQKHSKNIDDRWYQRQISLEEKQIENYIQKDSLYKYQNSGMGFFYTYKKKRQQGRLPKKGDIVHFSWEVSGLNGQVIYPKNRLGIKRYRVDESDILKGLREGIKRMKKTEQVRFIFLSYMAYGLSGDGKKIGINQPIVVDVELLKLEHK